MTTKDIDAVSKAFEQLMGSTGNFVSAEIMERQRQNLPVIEQDGLKYRFLENSYKGAELSCDADGLVTMTMKFEGQKDMVLTRENSILGPVHRHYTTDDDGYSESVGIYKLDELA